MDLNLLSNMLKELISANDRVSVPGLGYFFVEDVPASFSDRGYTINPPYRKLSFRTGGDNDGLLEKLYSESNPDISPSEAVKALGDFIARTKTELFSTKTVTLAGLGKLRATRENNLFFVADENSLLFPQYDYLEPISLRTRPAAEEAEVPKEEILPEAEEKPGTTEETETAVLEESPAPEEIPVPDKKLSPFAVTILVALSIAVLFFASLALLGRLCPEIIDPLLYSPEQLSVIHESL